MYLIWQNPEMSKSYNVKNTKNFLNWIISPETPKNYAKGKTKRENISR